jgi:DNA-binding protein YbaB
MNSFTELLEQAIAEAYKAAGEQCAAHQADAPENATEGQPKPSEVEQ